MRRSATTALLRRWDAAPCSLACRELGLRAGPRQQSLTDVGHDGRMTVIKVNAIEVDPTSGDELARRFTARAGAVDSADGFEGFELLRPTDDRHTWLVMTRWRDEAAFVAWTSSPAFAQGHRGAGAPSGGMPLATHSELWSYEAVPLPGASATPVESEGAGG